MDDPLHKFIEQHYDRMNREAMELFPQRRPDIDALLMRAGSTDKDGEQRVRGVKGSRGRPQINKSVLAGWMVVLVDVVRFAEIRAQIAKGIPLTQEIIPSKRWAFKRIAKMGLTYSIAEGSNLIKYRLASPETLKRHHSFARSDEVDRRDLVDAYRSLAISLSLYLGHPPEWMAYFFKQVGEDSGERMRGWATMHSEMFPKSIEPWQCNLRVDTENPVNNTPNGPPMHLDFPQQDETTWRYLKDGYLIWDSIEIETLKANPPSEGLIAAIREWKRNNSGS